MLKIEEFIALELSNLVFILLINVKHLNIYHVYKQDKFHAHLSWAWKWAMTCDFQQCDILTSVDSDQPVQPFFQLRNS